MNTVILGNSGSGKTWLATRLAASSSATMIHLDSLFWKPGGFDERRDDDEVSALIHSSKMAKLWIVEGVFGELAERYLSNAGALIWIDIDWPICRQRLEHRGSESKLHMGSIQSAHGLSRLIEWASAYGSRTDGRSFQGHQRLFEQFPGIRVRLRSEESVDALARDAGQIGLTQVLKRAALGVGL